MRWIHFSSSARMFLTLSYTRNSNKGSILCDKILFSANFPIWAPTSIWHVFCLDQWAVESQARQAFPQLHKRRTAETNQIITTTMSRFHTQFQKKEKGKKNIPALTIVKQTKGCTHCTAIRTGVCTHMSICTISQSEMQQRSDGCLSEVHGQYLIGKCTHTNADAHKCRRTQCKIQGRPTHGLLIPGCSFLKCGTMGSSPDCCCLDRFVMQPFYCQRMCGSLFCPYHRRGSFPRPAFTPDWSVTCRISTRWPHHTPGSFTFGSCLPNELKRPIVQLNSRPRLPLPWICTTGPISPMAGLGRHCSI